MQLTCPKLIDAVLAVFIKVTVTIMGMVLLSTSVMMMEAISMLIAIMIGSEQVVNKVTALASLFNPLFIVHLGVNTSDKRSRWEVQTNAFACHGHIKSETQTISKSPHSLNASTTRIPKVRRTVARTTYHRVIVLYLTLRRLFREHDLYWRVLEFHPPATTVHLGRLHDLALIYWRSRWR